MASAQAVAFEQAKAYLMKTDKNGNSVYDILVQLMTYIEENKIAGDVDFDKLLQMMKEDSLKASHQVVHAELEIDPPIFPEFAILQKQAPSQPQFNSGLKKQILKRKENRFQNHNHTCFIVFFLMGNFSLIFTQN